MMTDDTDKRLISCLRRNSRLPIAELARTLHLSRSTVKDRLARLELKGIIKGYSLVLNEECTKGHVTAHVMVNLIPNGLSSAMRGLKQIEQIDRAYAISGIYDLIVMVEAESTGELDKILDRIRDLEGIKDTLTSVVLSTKLEK